MAFGEYVITRKLAEGGMGAVYLASHPGSDQLNKVVKFVLADFVSTPGIVERFEQERRAALRLNNHKNIVRIDSFGQRDGEPYLVMEFLQGETLQEHLQRCRPISKQHAFRLICQIANALHALHGEEIIHRDLKPQNIFVVRDDDEMYRVKLIDFGIVHDRRAVGGLKTQHGAIVGTPGYMALEQFGNAANVTPAADVFALAVIIWEMFAGQLPWGYPENEFAIYDRQKTQPPMLQPGTSLPPEWEAILRQALSPNPADRPPLHALLFTMASAIPPEPPAPSGFQLLMEYAKRVVQNTPVEVETVRAADASSLHGPYWSMQHAATPAPLPGHASGLVSSDRIPLTATPLPQSLSTPTANERRGQMPSNSVPATTISGSSGVAMMPSRVEPTAGSRRVWLFGAGGVVIAAGLLVFAVSMGRSSRGTETRNASEPAQSSDTVTSVHSDAAVPMSNEQPDAAHAAAIAPPPTVTPDAGVEEALPSQQATKTPPTPTHSSTRTNDSTVRPNRHTASQKSAATGSGVPKPTNEGSAATQKKPFDLDAVKE